MVNNLPPQQFADLGFDLGFATLDKAMLDKVLFCDFVHASILHHRWKECQEEMARPLIRLLTKCAQGDQQCVNKITLFNLESSGV